MTTVTDTRPEVEIVFFQAYELQRVINSSDQPVENRYLQVLIETKGINVALSAEQLSHLEWVEVESGRVCSLCKRVDEPPVNRAADDESQQNLVTFVVEGDNKKSITLKARLELDGTLHETNGVTLYGACAAMEISDSPIDKAKWLDGSTTVPSDTAFTISLKKGINTYRWPNWPGYAYANSSVSVFSLSLGNKKIKSVTTVPKGDNLFHLGERIRDAAWSHCWWFHDFAAAREFDYGTLKGNVGGESIMFSYMGGFTQYEAFAPTGPEKFYFVAIDESGGRHDTVLSVTNATYVFRKATRTERDHYSPLLEKKIPT